MGEKEIAPGVWADSHHFTQEARDKMMERIYKDIAARVAARRSADPEAALREAVANLMAFICDRETYHRDKFVTSCRFLLGEAGACLDVIEEEYRAGQCEEGK